MTQPNIFRRPSSLQPAPLCHLPCPQDYVLTDTQKDFISDEDVAQLRDGAALMVVSKGNRALARPARERISFVPHPKTMTAAGDYEYFAAQVWAVQG